jgi:fatty-acyl-CoA synthase
MAGKSYIHNLQTHPFEWATVPEIMDRWAEKTPDKEAYVIREKNKTREAITFGELREKTEVIAGSMLRLGLRQGDFVIISGITSLGWILCDFAAARIGVIMIRCEMSALTKEGLVAISNINKVKGLLFHPGERGEFENHLRNIIPDAFDPQQLNVISCKAIPSLKYLISMSYEHEDHITTNLSDLMRGSERTNTLQKIIIDPGDIAVVFLSSGSTGFPKSIPYSHFNIINGYAIDRKSVV